ncbi:MAG: MmgE/PrpD family protein [Pseudomonadota bacterium]
MTDAINDICAHVVGTQYDDLSPTAIEAAKTFILDTLGVGIGGGTGPGAADLVTAMAAMGSGEGATVWATGQTMPAAHAAMCNAYQIHCQEFDCVHEEAVAHVMTVVLPCALAHAERVGGIDGKALMTAVVLGVDVASALGSAATSGLRFFRPATAGAMGAAAALGKLMGFDAETLRHACSLAYGQVCGTMQAHTEGSGLMAMQIGFNARNAVTACDLAAAGFTGPENILEGPFGYFTLIEDGSDLGPHLARLGKDWRITEVAHKPFPSGRATHGILDGCLALQRAHGFTAGEVSAIRLSVPPLIRHLVGRPPTTRMAINYARLSAAYVTACALHEPLTREDFTDAAYLREDRQALANRVSMQVREGDDPNALVPIHVEIELADGTVLLESVEQVYGCPENPMSRDAQLEKFRMCWSHAHAPLTSRAGEAMIDMIDRLEALSDFRDLVALTRP